MPFHAHPGDTLLLPKRLGQTTHLYVILTESTEIPAKTVIVNLTTKRDYSDTTVILDKNDHPFINHPTVVNFVDAMLVEIDALKNAVNSGHFHANDPFDSSILKIIQNGLLKSPLTPKKIKDYCSSRFP